MKTMCVDNLIFIYLTTIQIFIVQSAKPRQQSNVTAILNQLLNGYDSRLRPGFGGLPTVVKTDIMIRSMGPISEVDMTYSMDAYFRQTWVDKRLQFHGPLPEMAVHIKMLERIWKPDTYFYNGMGSYMHTITTPNKLLRIKQDGTILYSMRLTIKASCPMYLQYFPVDQQQCPLQLGSYAYTRDQVEYIWKRGADNSIKIAEGMTLSQFDLVGHPAGNNTVRKRNGEFSSLKVTFKLQRHVGYFLLQVYVPCTLIVILSWVSFWINREATADRIGLGITTVLTLTTLSMDCRTDLPKVPYATALDIFVIMCFVFVTASMLEFAGVHYFTKIGSGEVNHSIESEEEEEDVDYYEDSIDHTNNIGYSAYTNNAYNNKSHVNYRCRTNQNNHYQKQHLLTTTSLSSHSSGRMTTTTTTTTSSQPTSSLRPGATNQVHSSSFLMPTTKQGSPKKEGSKPKKETFLYKLFKCMQYDDEYKRMIMKKANPTGQNSTSQIDQVSRVLFPFSFIGCNVLYWVSYFR